MNRYKKIILNITLIIISCLVSFLLLEVGLRIFFPLIRPRLITKKNTPSNFIRKIKYGQPLFEGIFQCAEYVTAIRTNSEGFRDTEHQIEKSKGVFRIIVLGDSFTYGLGVEAEQAYPKVLERILNEKSLNSDVHYEVFNMGIAGIGTLEERQILEYAIRYKPDLVLLGLFVENRWNPDNGNDLYDNFKSAKIPLKPKRGLLYYLNSLQIFLATYSDTYFLLMTRAGTFLRKFLIGLRENQNLYELGLSWRITKEELTRFGNIAYESGAEFALIRIPFLFDAYSSKPDATSRILEEFGRENKLNVCDLLTPLRRQKDKSLYYPADGHWKSLAHTLAAKEIYSYLANNRLLDRR